MLEIESKNLTIEPQIKQELLKLNEKFELFIVSSSVERVLNKYLVENKIEVFKEILGSETHRSKEVKFAMLLEKYGWKKEECVFATDTLGDLKEANKIGIKSIAVDFGFHNRERLEQGNPLHIVSEFSEIRRIMEGLSRHIE